MKDYKINKNPNEEEYLEITEAVKANDNYCPCLTIKNEDTKCMCKDFRESADNDFCHCGRFYKVKEYPGLAVIGDISDFDTCEGYITWCELLGYNDFIVYGIPINITDYHWNSTAHINLCKTKIAKAEAVLILPDICEEAREMVDELLDWAERLGKKILTSEDLK